MRDDRGECAYSVKLIAPHYILKGKLYIYALFTNIVVLL